MKFVSALIIFTSLNFILANNPMMMVMLIILLTTFISMMLLILMTTSWASYMLFLIMLGGMMVLFIYISSIMSNENFKITYANTLIVMLITTLVSIFMWYLNIKHNFLVFLKINMNLIYYKLYWSPSTILILFIILYLLFTLIVSVQIIKTKNMALRKMFKHPS